MSRGGRSPHRAIAATVEPAFVYKGGGIETSLQETGFAPISELLKARVNFSYVIVSGIVTGNDV
jgi:hypothetical protein